MGYPSVLADPGCGFFLDYSSPLPDNRARHSSPVLQMFVGRVHDGLRSLRRDVALHNLDGLSCEENVFGKNRVHAIILPR